MPDLLRLSWGGFDAAVQRLAHHVHPGHIGIYGVPRGGLPLAVALSHVTGVPLLAVPRAGCVIVDDIADSGRTLLDLRKHKPAVMLAWVVRWPCMGLAAGAVILGPSDRRQVVFPWETGAANDDRRAVKETLTAELEARF